MRGKRTIGVRLKFDVDEIGGVQMVQIVLADSESHRSQGCTEAVWG